MTTAERVTYVQTIETLIALVDGQIDEATDRTIPGAVEQGRLRGASMGLRSALDVFRAMTED